MWKRQKEGAKEIHHKEQYLEKYLEEYQQYHLLQQQLPHPQTFWFGLL